MVVSDIGLSGRDGYALMPTLREITASLGKPALCTVALTAFVRPRDRERALDAAFEVHLSKPVEPHVLMAAISRLLVERPKVA